MKKTINEHDIDVIVTANILPAYLANFCGRPIVHDYLDHWEESASVCYRGTWKEDFIKRVVKHISDYNVRNAREVITVTDELKKYLVDNVKQAPYITVIPNGVDTTKLILMNKSHSKERIGLKSTDKVVGYVGSLEEWVSLEPVIRGMKYINAKLLIIGSFLYGDSYYKKLVNLVKSEGVQDKVIFKGYIPYDKLSVYISAMDIGLNPLTDMIKNKYSAGGKVFNYLSCGTPVLSTDVVSLRRMFSVYPVNERGVYFYDNTQDGIGFSSEFTKVMESSSQFNYEKFRTIALKYDWKKLAKGYLDVLHYADIKNLNSRNDVVHNNIIG
jgi:glycosyltransferase involved in cell wall biosynthesis